MSASSKSAFFASIALALAWVQAGGCSASAGNRGDVPGLRDGGPSDVSVIDAPLGDQGAGGLEDLNALCGQALCLPDSPVGAPGDGGTGLPPPASGGGADGGEGGQSGAAQGGDGGESAQGGQGGMSAEGGQAGAQGGADSSGGEGGTDSTGASGAAGSPDTPTPIDACRVMRKENKIVSDWAPAGNQALNGPCFSSQDCRPGLGCVNHEDVGGRCLPFCCAGNDSCTAQGTYCAPRRLLEMPLNASPANAASGLLVPVCVVAVTCSLEQPYPCPQGADCACKNSACLVVRSGITSCEVPDDGTAGQSCPCAWGHVCSQNTNTCVELCSTATDAKACSQGKCQDSAELPQGWGVCVPVATSR